MERLENVARPPTAATVSVPDSAPPLGLLAMATVTLAVEGTWLPNASVTRTVTAGARLAAATAFDGWVRNASVAGGPAPTCVVALAVKAGVTVSVAVTDWAPRVRKVTLGVAMPATRLAVAGKTAAASVTVRFAVPLYEVAV